MESASCAARRAVASLRRDQNRSGVSRTVCAVRAPVRAAGGLSTSRSAPGCSGSRRMQLRVASPGGMSLEKQRQQGSRRPLTAVHAIPPSAEEVFNFENIAVFPLWLAMILAPNSSLTKRVLGSDILFVSLALIYAYLTYVSFGFSSGGSQDLAALTRAFSYPETVAVGWAHFIAQDLLVGRFIWVDGVRNKVFTAHSLLLTLFFGPLGALSHIVTRAALGKADGDVLRLDPEEK